MHRLTFFPAIWALTICILLPTSVYAAISVNVRVVGTCDAYFNNLGSGPEQVATIPDGTICTAKITVKKKRKPLRNRRIAFYHRVPGGHNVGTKRKLTNAKGIVQFSFIPDGSACYYRAYDTKTITGKNIHVRENISCAT